MIFPTTPYDIIYYTLPLTIPVMGGLLILLSDLFSQSKEKNYLSYLAIITQIIPFFILLRIALVKEELTLFSGMFQLSGTSLLASLIILVSGIFTAMIAPNYLNKHQIHIGEFYTLLLFATTTLMLMVMSTHLFLLLITFEIVSFVCYILVGFLRGSPFRAEVLIKYFLPGTLFSILFLFAISLLYGQSGSLYFATIATMNPHTLLFPVSFILILFPIFFKIAIVPLHHWTPDIYEAAPAPVIHFIAISVKIAIFTILIHLFPTLIDHFKNGRFWINLLFILGLISMVLGTLLALVQTNLKRLMGYSTMIHSGLLLMGISSYIDTHDPALKIALFNYFVIYLLMNSGLFTILSLMELNHQGVTLNDLSGLHHRKPFIYGILILLLLSMVGLPPTGGFIAKFYLFKAIYDTSLFPIGVLIAIALTILSSIVYLRPILYVHQEPKGKDIFSTPQMGEYFVLTTVSLTLLITGIVPQWLNSLIDYLVR